MEWFRRTYYIDDPINVKSPLELSHIQSMRFHLLILNFWPEEALGISISKYKILITYGYLALLTCLATGGFMYTSSRELTFLAVGHIYIVQVLFLAAAFRFITIAKECKFVMATFLKEVHLLYHQDKSEYAVQMYRRIHKITHCFTVGVMTETFCSLVIFSLIPVYKNYSKGLFEEKIIYNASYEHGVYYEFPLPVHTHFNYYLFTIPVDLGASYFNSTCFIIVDLLLTSMVIHLWGHIKILIHDLSTFPLPQQHVTMRINNENYELKDMYSEEESARVAMRLGKCIEHHRFIIKFADMLSGAFGPMIFVYYIVHMGIGCLLLLLCSQMTVEALITYGPLTFIVYQLLIQLSMIFELIGSASEKLIDYVYGLPWEYMGKSNRKTVLIFLIRVQEPIHVKALGLADVGVTSMAAIIRTSFTYFMFLRTFPTEES